MNQSQSTVAFDQGTLLLPGHERDEVDLMYQWHRRILLALGYDTGVIGDNTFNVRPVSVTTYDSLAIHAAKLGALIAKVT